MTVRERILAVLKGQEHDLVPFVSYDGICAPNDEVLSVLGHGNIGFVGWVGAYTVETPNCRVDHEEFFQDGLRGVRNTLHTPEGDLVQEKRFEPAFNTAATKEHYVKEPEDYKKLIAYFRDLKVHPAPEYVARAAEAYGDNGLPHTALPRTPYQALWVEYVSIQDLCLHMVDCPELVEECISLYSKYLQAIMEATCQADMHYVVFGDNITAPVIGEKNFRRYCMPNYNKMAEMLADRNIPVIVHMDGDLKPLWQAIGETKLGGLESFSPPPDNDTSVAEALKVWPNMRIWVNFPSSIHLASDEVIYRTAMQILEEGGHSGRLQIQISENVPPGIWRRTLPVIAQAIKDFGKP